MTRTTFARSRRIGAARRARAGHRKPGDRDPSDNRADPDGPLHARLGS